ncbi:hypothetical protein KC332_g2795 [Hortaea werneckii]|uniref:Uncharacterized protein n=1 Tax=Hortaea werneckii EXF-2000 TaxID=1157616 RepID=A0A1Z5TKE7_HORWE|nr:hypothetical protein KC358_g2654 [Hortaea werneckii]OTA36503.1 hypothetical protein BTJ68_03622 [Hortaea werneckii EXF-2000]KAI6850143.1 hypothetical protein KC350_g2259 [Hortaea werneckii]KAI6940647.1 hypothetical protein KC341_g3386 [Hortaea werneckii]KAI6941796.1 hypothetical protein KC348_g4625 [Hortaea werneckii]
MLPLADTTILGANPKFAALYRDLSSNKLNADGTSKLDAKALKEHEAFEKDIQAAQVKSAKRQIIQSGLSDLVYRGDELPEELQDLVGITAASLAGDIGDEDKDIIADELESFHEYALRIAEAISKNIQKDTTALASLLSPENAPRVEELANTIHKIQENLASSTSRLSELRISLAQEIPSVHELYREIIETSIRILEQTIHGSVARGTKAKADYLAVVAEGMSKKLALQHGQLMQQIYTPEIQETLRNKQDDLDAESLSLKRKVREMDERLAAYRQERGMKQMVGEYAELMRETERVEREIDRLETGGR